MRRGEDVTVIFGVALPTWTVSGADAPRTCSSPPYTTVRSCAPGLSVRAGMVTVVAPSVSVDSPRSFSPSSTRTAPVAVVGSTDTWTVPARP